MSYKLNYMLSVKIYQTDHVPDVYMNVTRSNQK